MCQFSSRNVHGSGKLEIEYFPEMQLLLVCLFEGVYQQSRKNEQQNISFYVRPAKRKDAVNSDDDDDDESYDPGARTLTIKTGSVAMKYCRTCKFFRPPRCSHCAICERCIDVC